MSELQSQQLQKEGKQLHDEFIEFQSRALSVNSELESSNVVLHHRCEAECKQAVCWSQTAHENLLRGAQKGPGFCGETGNRRSWSVYGR